MVTYTVYRVEVAGMMRTWGLHPRWDLWLSQLHDCWCILSTINGFDQLEQSFFTEIQTALRRRFQCLLRSCLLFWAIIIFWCIWFYLQCWILLCLFGTFLFRRCLQIIRIILDISRLHQLPASLASLGCYQLRDNLAESFLDRRRFLIGQALAWVQWLLWTLSFHLSMTFNDLARWLRL